MMSATRSRGKIGSRTDGSAAKLSTRISRKSTSPGRIFRAQRSAPGECTAATTCGFPRKSLEFFIRLMFLAMLRAANPMLGRKQELNLQFLQITDGILMVVAFWIAHQLRFFSTDLYFFSSKPIGPFSQFQWLLFVILPFGPIVLEL